MHAFCIPPERPIPISKQRSIYSSSISWWRPRTLRLNSSISLSHNSAASPLRGDALYQISKISGGDERRGDALIGLPKQALQTQEDRLDVVRSSPLILQDIQADATREVNIGVVDRGLEEDGRGSIRVVGREGEG
jgi:hypothetical protein